MRAAGDEAGDVRGVEEEQRSDLVGDLAERLRVDDPRVRRGARDDQLRSLGEREVADLVEVDALVGRGEAVRNEAEQAARSR